MNKRKLGSSGPVVSMIGLGCMGMSDFYGPADRGESIATIHAALDAGITLLDTGDFYGMGHNEMLIREALRRAPRTTMCRSASSSARCARPTSNGCGITSRPAAVKNFLCLFATAAGSRSHRHLPPSAARSLVPIEDTIGAIADMVKAGYVRHIGLSEVGADTIRRAHAVHPISDLQIEYSLMSRGIESDILKTCRQLGIGITAYGVLSRGLISGHWAKDRAVAQDFRATSPRFQAENLDANLALVNSLVGLARQIGATSAQVAIAWVAAQGNDIVPLVGARRRDRLSLKRSAQCDVTLEPAHLAELLAKAFPPGVAAGARYPEIATRSHGQREAEGNRRSADVRSNR